MNFGQPPNCTLGAAVPNSAAIRSLLKVVEQRDPGQALIRSIKRPDFSVRQLFCVLCDHLDRQKKDTAELARQERLDFVVTERRHAPDSRIFEKSIYDSCTYILVGKDIS